MMTVVGCIAHQHDPWLVLLSLFVCVAGSWVTARLFGRATAVEGPLQFGWYFLTSVSAAASVWSAHFVAILGFEPGVPVSFDPVMTIVSLLVAMAGCAVGLTVAGHWRSRTAGPLAGGVVVGLAIASMHYTGMLAYRISGISHWDRSYVVASIALSVVLSVIAMRRGTRGDQGASRYMGLWLAFAIAALHFTAMAAFRIDIIQAGSTFSDPGTRHAFALAVAGMAIVVVSTGLVSWIIDDRLRTESIEGLHRMALTDNLTGLPNRLAFGERLAHEIGVARNRGGQLAVIGIDLDRFKEINDLRGHQAGDEVLRALADRMTMLLRAGESIARVGGDEFVALKPFDTRADLTDFLSRLEPALFAPVRHDDWDFPLGASLGVAIYPQDGVLPGPLLNNADLAMYRAKADPLTTVCFYEAGMDELARERLHLAADLRDALARNQLRLHYQVQTSVSTGRPIGYEALLRWEHPERGLIPPAEFIPLAEESGLILPIGEWVLREACAQATSWAPPYNVAVNLSAVQFAHSDLPALVEQVLAETGLTPERLELELTESTIFADRDRSLQTLRRIKALGVTIALDDFGTGYSSLDTLRSFPFDKIKLDRSFTSEVVSSPQATAIIRAVLALGKSLGIPVLAEGIETADQLQMLEDEGCDEAQGFLMGRPVPLRQIVESGQLTLTHCLAEFTPSVCQAS